MNKQYISRAVATAAATLLLAAPLVVSAQTTAPQMPTPDQANSIKALTEQFFDDVHYTKLDAFNAITGPNFQVTLPDGSTLTADQVIGRAAARNLEESGYLRSTSYGEMTTDGSTITEHVKDMDTADLIDGERNLPAQTSSSQRTLTWMRDDSGNWVLVSERIDSIDQSPYGSQYNS